jgi:hypothetical protein
MMRSGSAEFGFEVGEAGLEGGKVVCGWRGRGGVGVVAGFVEAGAEAADGKDLIAFSSG